MRIVNDNIHGDISLTKSEWQVVNTATFQRLRSLKQLGMGHLVYPNATHTRFAHSLGVFSIMSRVLNKLAEVKLSEEDRDNLRLAALLHDIGHYPYSHLMERVANVTLIEEELNQKSGTISGELDEYPDHEELGRHILMQQSDIRAAIGGTDRAETIGSLFSRLKGTDQQLSKLIHSSLDMDRLDYLLRDARAAGVPYGEIDLNYLLNSIRISPKGMLGVDEKALAAAGHFLLARVFMHRVVYYHKTTFGFEEACRQLLRRARDSGRYAESLPASGAEVRTICEGTDLSTFTDDYVDRLIHRAARDTKDTTIAVLANCLLRRQPPRLLMEVGGVEPKAQEHTARSHFKLTCRHNLQALADEHRVPVGRFLLCGPKPIKFEERGSLFTRDDARNLQPEEREELIMILRKGQDEPQSIVDFDRSVIKSLSNQVFTIQRLYVVQGDLSDGSINSMQATVQSWTRPPR